ncbi:tRNA (guanosine(37)-N1)-methyltransferase TrmD [Candidatus Clavichlamydia salmonicola]|uniref:tRNA (guanosine(37)-N1)-methyltransferase TrmD n=1 Tax=Candidatus Clavichlamydia salmonicola TaxID=469812 RepID=UPI001891816B|nr:tRNA (guanosine(37)-N1)-methyltransferase TrmD [Candidatus Clavichlamydia salmonicola]
MTKEKKSNQLEIEIEIISLFPNYFQGPFDHSIISKAKQAGLVSITHHDLREYGVGVQRQVDDRVYGGGPGMILKPEPLLAVLSELKKDDSYVVLMSPQGKLLDANKAKELALKPHLIFICGHYEGIDERVRIKEVDEEVSIGDYVLTNGALASIVVIDALLRFVPGVIGNVEAVKEDSFENGLFDAPHYTRPVEIDGMTVPAVLLEGNHKEIVLWRKQQAIEKTSRERPDLYFSFCLNAFHNEKLESIKDTKFSFEGVVLFVKDLAHSKNFYEKILGFHFIESKDDQISFVFGTVGMLHLKQSEEKVVSDSVIRVINLGNQRDFAYLCSLLQKKCKIKPVLDICGSRKQIFFRDPDGYQWAVILKIVENNYEQSN